MSELLGRLDLPADLAAYLIWLTSSVGDHWGRIEADLDALPTVWGSDPPALSLDAESLARLSDDWPVMVERLQLLAALTAAEARRRGLVDVAGLHDAAQWTVVPERPARWRELMAIAGIQRADPPFPADPAFAPARPEARDRAGAMTGARQREFLAGRSTSRLPDL